MNSRHRVLFLRFSAFVIGGALFVPALSAQFGTENIADKDIGRPPQPPLITLLGIVNPGKLATDPSLPLKGPVAEVLYEELRGQQTPAGPAGEITRSIRTTYSSEGHPVDEVRTQSGSQSITVSQYVGNRLVSQESTSPTSKLRVVCKKSNVEDFSLMKKTLLMLAGLAATAGLASAGLILVQPCAVLMFPNTTGNTGSICSATADAGDYLTSMTIGITDDYTGYQTGSPVLTYSGTLTQSAALFTAPTFCNVITIAIPPPPGSQACFVTINPSATVTNANTALAAYTIQITNAGDVEAGGAVSGASEVLTISATEAPIPTSGVPEPTTFGLVGGALLGLGLLRKKATRS